VDKSVALVFHTWRAALFSPPIQVHVQCLTVQEYVTYNEQEVRAICFVSPNYMVMTDLNRICPGRAPTVRTASLGYEPTSPESRAPVYVPRYVLYIQGHVQSSTCLGSGRQSRAVAETGCQLPTRAIRHRLGEEETKKKGKRNVLTRHNPLRTKDQQPWPVLVFRYGWW